MPRRGSCPVPGHRTPRARGRLHPLLTHRGGPSQMRLMMSKEGETMPFSIFDKADAETPVIWPTAVRVSLRSLRVRLRCSPIWSDLCTLHDKKRTSPSAGSPTLALRAGLSRLTNFGTTAREDAGALEPQRSSRAAMTPDAGRRAVFLTERGCQVCRVGKAGFESDGSDGHAAVFQ